MTARVRALTSSRRLARNALWNFGGLAAPMVVALFAIPLLIEGMGKERFGLLAIVWMGVGYFSLFDLGLGRALTRLVAERLGRGAEEGLGELVWTALFLIAALGALGAAVVLSFAGPLVAHVLNVAPALQDEAVAAFRILAVGLPLVVVTSALVGLLEAYQRFAVIAAVRLPLGLLTFAGPLLSLQFSASLAWATAVLLLGRCVALAAYFHAAATTCPVLRRPQRPVREQMSPLFRFGGWLTVSNIVGPLMTYLDRFFVGALLNMNAVAHYATPYEVLSRLQVLPQAVLGVLFPALSTAAAAGRERLVSLYGVAARSLPAVMLPVTAGFFLFAPEGLGLWLGEEFRAASTPVVWWLAAGWMINCLALPPYTVLQSVGRPDLVAKTHLAELLPYLGMLWALTAHYGIAGTAAAWTLRVLVDTVLLNEIAGATLADLRAEVRRTRLRIVAVAASFAVFALSEALALRLALLTGVAVWSATRLWPVLRSLLAARRGDRPELEPTHE